MTVPNTSILTDYTHNLSAIISEDAVNEPVVWLANVNLEATSYLIPASLIVIGVVLFAIVRKSDNINDAEALSYAGLIISIASILLFVAGNVLSGVRLISWVFIWPVLVLTGIALFVNFSLKRY